MKRTTVLAVAALAMALPMLVAGQSNAPKTGAPKVRVYKAPT